MSSLKQLLGRLWRSRRIASLPDLQEFWAARAAFIAQKCVIEYCRARAGMNWQKLFAESMFQQAVHRASWQAWQVTLLDVAEMFDAIFRPHVSSAVALHGWLQSAGERIIAQQPFPDLLPADFAETTRHRLRALLEELSRRPPAAVKDIPKARAGEVFAAIPIHPDLKAPDEDYITNTLRAFLVRACEDLQQQADVPLLAREMDTISRKRDRRSGRP